MNKLFSQLIAIFGLMMVTLSGWGADQCSSVTDSHTFTESSPNNYYEQIYNNNSFDNNNNRYFYLSVPIAGTLTFHHTSTASVSYAYNLNGCSSFPTILNDGDTIHLTTDTDLDIRLHASANNQHYNFNFTFVADQLPPVMGNVPNQIATVGIAYSLNIASYVTLTNADPITSYTLTGTLPAGLSFNTTTGVISGTPTTSGSAANFTVTATDNDGISNSDNFTITVNAFSFASNNWRQFSAVNYPGDHNMKGDIAVIGNSVMTAVGGSCLPTTTRNNDTAVVFADIDSDSSTFNSTSAELRLPATATDKEIIWAGLYWQGYLVDQDDANKTNAKTILFKTPTSSNYVSLTSDTSKFNWLYVTGSSYDRFYYQGVADVTAMVKAAGEGYYTVANLYSNTLQTDLNTLGGAFGAWSIVVVYKDSSTTLKNISAYDGYVSIGTVGASASGPVFSTYDIDLSGFLTPTSGAVNSSFLVFAGEGDAGSGTGDHTQLSSGANLTNLIDLYNPLNPADNIYNASITDKGVAVTNRNPSCANTIGADIDKFDVGSTAPANTQGQVIQNSQTHARVRLNSTGDGYFPGVFAFSTDIYQPLISIVKSTNSSGELTPDQTITYTANITNTGNEGASNIVIYDNFDDNNLTKIDGNITDPLVTLGDLLDHNTTTILDSVVCNYGPSHTDCKSSCSVGLNPFKIACSIPLMAVGETAYMQFQTKIASNPDTHGQSVKVENKMYATYYNALTGAAVDQTSSNLADAGQYLYSQNLPASGFDAREISIAGEDRSIWTKIVNKPFQLNVVSLDTGGAIAPYTVPTGNRVYLFPVDSSVCLLSDSEKLTTIASLSRSTYVDFANGDTTKPSPAIDLSNALLSAVAGRDKRIALNYVDWGTSFQAASFSCSNSNTQAVLLGVPQCLNADHKIGDVFGQLTQDVCAGGAAHGMNPALANPPCQSNSYNAGNLPSAPFDNAYGCYQCISGMAGKVSCSTDNFAVRPDRFVFTASTAKMKAGEDYSLNVVAYDNNGNNAQEYDQSVSNLTGAPTTWWQRDANVVLNLVNTQGTTTISGAGTFSNGVGTVPIRFSDVGKFTLELSDTEWASVDSSDGSTSDMMAIKGDSNVTFVPFNFNISVGRIVNNDGVTPSFTYLSSDLKMSARIPMTIQARNKQGALTQNYANNMYERSITITPSVSSVTATARGLTRLTDGATNANADFISGSTSIVYNDPLVARFNFSRDPKVAISPFDVYSSNGVGNDVNVSITDADSVYGNKNQTLDGYATFVYGRLIPRDIRVFGNNPFTATAWYEVFNAPRINGTILTPSRNESMWYINNLHNDATGGDANVSAVVTATNTVGLPLSPVSNGTGIETYPFAGETPPYSAKAHIAVSPWLWYGPAALTYTTPGTDCSTHPCFNINVVPSVGATGSSKDQNVGAKTNKSTSGGAGGWKSTRDYAPAIR